MLALTLTAALRFFVADFLELSCWVAAVLGAARFFTRLVTAFFLAALLCFFLSGALRFFVAAFFLATFFTLLPATGLRFAGFFAALAGGFFVARFICLVAMR